MKKSVLIPFLFIGFSATAQSWLLMPDFAGTTRDDAAAFVVGQNAWCGTGLQTGWTNTRDFFRFDMITETWSTAPGLPPGEERQYACGFSNGTFGFVFGGLDAAGNYLDDVWRFDPAGGSWTARTSMPAPGRSGAACFVIDSFAFVVGGQRANTIASKEVWRYNMNADTWQQCNPLPGAGSWRATAAACNGTGYLIFGKDSAGTFSNALLRYNMQNDSWTAISNFPGLGRTYGAMQGINNKLVVFAGVDSSQLVYGDCFTFDPLALQWQQQPSLPNVARKGGAAFTNGTDLYYTTGIDQQNNRLDETWKLADATGVHEAAAHETFSLFPIPANDAVQVLLPGIQQEQATITLRDVSGRALVTISALQNRTVLPTANLPAGFYFVQVQRGGSVAVKQLAITH